MTITPLTEVRRDARAGNVVPVTLEFPADLLTPVSAYLRLVGAGKGKGAALLESVEGGERIARYSFIALDPFERWVIRDGKLFRQDLRKARSELREITGDPLQGLATLMKRYRAARRPGLPPFCGGAIGYVGYECSGLVEDIPAPQARSTGPNDASLQLFATVVAFDHVRRSVVLIRNIFTDEGALKPAYDRAVRELKAIRARLFRASRLETALELDPSREADLSDFEPALGRRRHEAAVSRIKEHIRAGDIFQCVLSDQFRFRLRGRPFSVYRALRMVSPAPYLFHLDFGDETLIGASPEMLTRADPDAGGKLETCPIAGTRPRGANPSEDLAYERQLMASVKEKAEHLMLVDLGRNDLGRVSKPGSVRVSQFMQVERFSHVMHLVSRVEGVLKPGKSTWDSLFSCFPAGTLTGAPKIRAQEIIAALEPVRRGPYGGAVVYSDFSGRLDSCIAIRSLYVRGSQGVIQAGGGVVADSRAASEYDEIRNKTRAMRRAIGAVGAIAPKTKRGRR